MAILLHNATLATMVDGYGLTEDGAVAIEGGRIAWVGQMYNLPATLANLPRHDCDGRLLTPGLIDCHSHIVFGGDRAVEFEMRLNLSLIHI